MERVSGAAKHDKVLIIFTQSWASTRKPASNRSANILNNSPCDLKLELLSLQRLRRSPCTHVWMCKHVVWARTKPWHKYEHSHDVPYDAIGTVFFLALRDYRQTRREGWLYAWVCKAEMCGMWKHVIMQKMPRPTDNTSFTNFSAQKGPGGGGVGGEELHTPNIIEVLCYIHPPAQKGS
jgi:hypothetical protein